jgi:hypothetical protein
MEFRVLDEVVEIEGNGLMLFAAEEDCRMLFDGCRIRDSKGNIHIVDRISCHDGLSTLFIRGGHANYFRRLFRNIFVDATLFVPADSEAGD